MSTEEEGGDPVVGDGASTAAGPELIRRTRVGSPESRLYLIYISILGLGLVVPFLAGGALLGLSFTTMLPVPRFRNKRATALLRRPVP